MFLRLSRPKYRLCVSPHGAVCTTSFISVLLALPSRNTEKIKREKPLKIKGLLSRMGSCLNLFARSWELHINAVGNRFVSLIRGEYHGDCKAYGLGIPGLGYFVYYEPPLRV